MLVSELPGWFREEGVLEAHLRETGRFITIKGEPMSSKETVQGTDEVMRRTLSIEFEKEHGKIEPLAVTEPTLYPTRVPDTCKSKPMFESPPLKIPKTAEECQTVEEFNMWRIQKGLPPVLEKGAKNCFGEEIAFSNYARCYLHAFNSPLWDTEYVLPGTTSVRLFMHQLGSVFEYIKNKTKTEVDTNMNQPGMIDFPCEHTVNGFNISIDSNATEMEKEEIRRQAVMWVTFHGRRPYFYMPLERLPRMDRKPIADVFNRFVKESMVHAQLVSGDHSSKVLAVCPDSIDMWREQFKKAAAESMYDYTVDKDRHIQIVGGIGFGARIAWNEPLKISQPLRITLYIEGKHWIPQG